MKDWVDRIMIQDASGVITPEGTRELVSTVQRNSEVFSVKISPVWDGAGKAETTMQAETPQTPRRAKRSKELPSGAVVAG